MTDVDIGTFNGVVTVRDDRPEAGAPAGPQVAGGGGVDMGDIARIRALLRPIIIELLEDELDRYMRMRG